VDFRLRESEDTSRLIRYYVGNVNVYPDINADTVYYRPKVRSVGEYQFITYPGLFRPEKLVDFIYLHKGDLYRQSNYLKTVNKFGSLSAWRFASINPIPRPGQDTVDFHIRLTPATKYHFSTNIEASRNVGNLSGITQGSLIGLGANLNLQNRNFLRGANLATHNFRYGVELGNNIDSLIQAQQLSFTNTVQFPRMVPRLSNAENIRTIFALNLGSTLRKSFFTVNSFNTSWGWERSVDNKLFGLRFPNIEYNFLKRGELLDSLIKENASYRYIFNTGLIVSAIANRSVAWGNNKVSNLFSISGEGAGLMAGFIKGSKFLDSNLYRFLKVDAEFRRTYNIRRTAIALRAFSGAGYGLTRSVKDTLNFYLPFFRQYYTGGPNSMRAWPIRRLGPGSTLKSFNRNIAPDRFGDIRLEANAEYRFYMFEANGIFFNGALFTDVGNVWFLRRNNDFPDGQFPDTFDKLWKDIAIGAGTGLRVDFGFLKLRMDYAYRVKDPSPDILKSDTQNKWFYNWKLLNGQFQLGIDYPF
jgi:outer membrane protein insertion porin family